MFTVSEEWRAAYPGAVVGVLAMAKVANPKSHEALNEIKAGLEAQIRARYRSKEEIRSLQRLQAYRAYYKQFKKTYHVQMQLESVTLKNKSIPNIAALVEVMFIAELKNQLLTAGHDLDVVQKPVRLDVASGDECFVRLNGQEQQLKAGDMFISDRQGVLSAVIYGPDQRTRIGPSTTRALFTVYAPSGIGEAAVRQHLQDIESYARLIAPEAKMELLEIYDAG
jgi:DNA/RNA-binding domain of Phe-tRNA-synthetase-like protein